VRLRSPNAGSLGWQSTRSIEPAHAESVRLRSLSHLSVDFSRNQKRSKSRFNQVISNGDFL
jgi:hypothetical protein